MTEIRYVLVEGTNGWCIHDCFLGWGSPFSTYEQAEIAFICLVGYGAHMRLFIWYTEEGKRVEL